MIKIPFLSNYITDDQEFYDTQINEELKYCECPTYVIRFIEVGKNKRALVIRTNDNKMYALPFLKFDYKDINETLATLRLNLALVEKEKNQDEDEHTTAQISSTLDSKFSEEDKENGVIVISSLDELLVDNKPLRKKDEAIQALLSYAMVSEDGKEFLDFYKAGYDRGIQNYLCLSLYDKKISVNDKLLKALLFFKSKNPKIYHLENSFMRGNFDEMFRYMDEIGKQISLSGIIKISQNILQAQEEMPTRKHDLAIYRVGLGVGKDKTIGAKNTYESFVSFGSSGGTFTDKDNVTDIKPIVYRKVLDRNEPAIPVDLLENLGIIYLDETQENEFLLPPFAFRVKSINETDGFEVFDIEGIERLNARQLLKRRVDELETYLKERNKIKELQDLQKNKNRILGKSKKRISRYNVKDIYYGLRPKNNKKAKDETDFIEL